MLNTLARPRATIATLIEAVADAAATARDQRHRAVGQALAPFLGDPDLLDGIPCPCGPDRYTRHLLHEDRRGGWAMVAIAWLPGQRSPVHGHRTWCAFGVHDGVLEERHFTLEAEGPVLRSAAARRVGATSAGPADIALIHQLANVSSAPALSIHVYGVGFDRFGDGVNHVYATA